MALDPVQIMVTCATQEGPGDERHPTRIMCATVLDFNAEHELALLIVQPHMTEEGEEGYHLQLDQAPGEDGETLGSWFIPAKELAKT